MDGELFPTPYWFLHSYRIGGTPCSSENLRILTYLRYQRGFGEDLTRDFIAAPEQTVCRINHSKIWEMHFWMLRRILNGICTLGVQRLIRVCPMSMTSSTPISAQPKQPRPSRTSSLVVLFYFREDALKSLQRASRLLNHGSKYKLIRRIVPVVVHTVRREHKGLNFPKLESSSHMSCSLL